MSKVLIWLGVLLIVVIAGIGLWWSGMLGDFIAAITASPVEQEQTSDTPEQQSELATGGDTSDQALDQDTAALDAQLDAYTNASAAVDESLEDDPIEQEY